MAGPFDPHGRNLPRGETLETKLLLAAGIAMRLKEFAQTKSQTNITVEPMAHTPTFRVNVVSRSVQAVNYRHRSGSSKLDFTGTDLMGSANGVAEVNRKRGSIQIDAEFWHFRKPTTF